ncbi:Dual adapter for phosphotyrosine and 3-phosphotyrosine and 3-phosphoinositide [Oopsacas minuta]|uniref:Dual adapter for phosphotyrosine and 3-phosphotyrosine and 3-phosphoinositide n=1 Tax=Oopsacas minuta TaxID=111878 RepID=A0AAV7JUW3_9METZ|nr:Dual adapter for phosphotyrosine and 3-phosphotyrosine and 3-phosphoinositide [Oopsacas minuta]
MDSDANTGNLPQMRKSSGGTNAIDTLPWYYPGTDRHAAECVLKTHDIDGSFIIIKERIIGDYEYYDLCVWNVGTPSHFQVRYRRDVDEIEFGLKKYSLSTFKQQFERPSRIVKSDRDVILLKHPLPNNVREPIEIWDVVITQDLVRSDKEIRFMRVKSDPNILSSCSLGVKGGYLIKRGHVRKNWKRRWFVLDKNILNYYEMKPNLNDNPNPKPKGIIDLSETIQFTAEDHSVKQPYCFAIHVSKKIYLISAETEIDYKSWVEALKTAIEKYQDTDKRNVSSDFV